MAITDYSSLQTTIANYLARTDLTAQIPDFIRLAETRMRRELRIRQMMKSATTTTTGGDATVALPPDFLEARDLIVQSNPVRVITYVSPSVFSRNTRSTESGVPVDYTILATEFKFAPIPDTNYTLEILYFAAPDYLSNTNTSNVFLAVCPDLVLYGALIEAEPYLMNDARLQVWAGMYQKGVDALTTSDEQAQYSGVPLAMTLTKR
jgi:hypothetical protein